jgi:putative DNA primase/helicase
MNNYDAVPEILKDLPQWIVWKLERRNGKATKLPYDAKKAGVYAKSNDETTWATFDVALDTASNITNDYDGVGFMLHGTDLVGIDFDGVLHDGSPEPFVLEILRHLGDPYSEITPSGNGLRAFVQCKTLPTGQRKFSGNKYGAEIYSGSEGGRYLTVTGNQFSGTGVPKIENIDIAYFMVTQIRNAKLKALWMGDTSEYNNDQSAADLALLNILKHLFNGDPQKMERYFSASVLGQREKWTQREDYRKRTIARALDGETQPEPEPAATKKKANALPAAEMIAITGDKIVPKRVKWLWRDRVPFGKITLYAGNPDNGKSLAGMDLAARVTTGRSFPLGDENKYEPFDVLMLLGEDDLDDTAVPRLMAAGADMKRIHFPEGVVRPNDSDSEVRLDLDLPALDAYLDKNPAIKLIVIDPITNYLGEVHMVAEQEARSILIPLKRLAAKRMIAVVMVMHLNKKSEQDAISRVGGAMAFIGVARCSWMFIRDSSTGEGEIKDSFSMARIKNNLTKASGSGIAYHIDVHKIEIPGELEPVWAPYAVWDESINKTADDVLDERREKSGGGRPKGTDDVLQEAVRWLEGVLGTGAKAEKWIADHAKHEADISPATLRRAKTQLKVKSRQAAGGWIWEMPKVMAVEPKSDDEWAPQDEDDINPETTEFELR